MERMHGQLGTATGLWYALALPALSWLLARSLLGSAEPGPAAHALALASGGLLTGFLLWPMLWRTCNPNPADLLRWLALSAVAGLPLLLAMPAAAWPALALPLLAGVLVLDLLLGTLTLALRHCLGGTALAAHRVLACLLLICGTAPLWLGPLAGRLAQQAFTDLVLALSPLSYLAGLIEYDLFRGAWFYAHTPLGGLRYEYPDGTLMTLFYCGMAALLLLVGHIRARHAGARTNCSNHPLRTLHEESTA
jgi:hypothetical protein